MLRIDLTHSIKKFPKKYFVCFIYILISIYFFVSISTFHHHEHAIFHNGKSTISINSELCIFCKVLFYFSSEVIAYKIQLLIFIVALIILSYSLFRSSLFISQKTVRSPPLHFLH